MCYIYFFFLKVMNNQVASKNILKEIIDAKRKTYCDRIRPIRESELARLADMQEQTGSFSNALTKKDRLSVIAEIKRKSPSVGQIAVSDLDAVEQARKYVNAEADCISILTNQEYFGGNLKDLSNVSEFLKTHQRATPCLCKDFMIHPVQILEAAEAGASCILIIVRALEDDEIKVLYEAASIANLDVIFEIHEEWELEKALKFDPKIIGVNNRDLGTFETNLSVSERLIPLIPNGIIKVSESGISETEDAERVKACGADAVLVGEALMRAENAEALIKAFHNA